MKRIHLHTRLLLSVAAILFVLSGVRIASAHAHFKASVPAPDSTVAPPQHVTASFSNHDPLEPSVSFLKVVDSAGAQVDMGDSKLDPADAGGLTLVVSLKPNLADGVYTVNWEAGAADAVSTGSFNFSVSASAPAAAPVAEAPAAAPATSALPATGADDVSMTMLLLAVALVITATGLHVRRRA